MPFGRKKHDDDRTSGWTRVTALVVDAEEPVEGMGGAFNRLGKSTIRVLYDAGSGPRMPSRSDHLKEEQWLVPGMNVPVFVDPADPDRFEVDWTAVSPIEERAAANDPTLADPAEARRKVNEAVAAAGFLVPGQTVAGAWVDSGGEHPDHFQELMDRASSASAPEGKTRAVVVIATIRPVLRSEGSDDHSRTVLSTDGRRPTVLSVHAPGRPPYAVYLRKFHHRRSKGDALMAGLPALVSTSDPNDVEVVWDEVPSAVQAITQVLADANATMQQAVQATPLELQYRAMASQAMAQPPGAPPAPGASPAPGTPPPMPPGMGQMGEQMKSMLAQSARTGLAFVKDPEQRRLMIENYRRAGLTVDDDGTVH
jgi:hypothetical protein